jgi:hypothetical protein
MPPPPPKSSDVPLQTSLRYGWRPDLLRRRPARHRRAVTLAAVTSARRVTGGRLSERRIMIHGAHTSGIGIADLVRAYTAAGSRASTSTGRLVDEQPAVGVGCNVILQVRRVVHLPGWSRHPSWRRRCAVDWVLPADDVALCPSRV